MNIEMHGKYVVTPHEILVRHFVEAGVHWSHQHPTPPEAGIHYIRVEGVDIVTWAVARADEALKAGPEQALATVLGKVEPSYHHMGVPRRELWRV